MQGELRPGGLRGANLQLKGSDGCAFYLHRQAALSDSAADGRYGLRSGGAQFKVRAGKSVGAVLAAVELKGIGRIKSQLVLRRRGGEIQRPGKVGLDVPPGIQHRHGYRAAER